MEYTDFVFELEDIAFQSRIIRATLDAVQDRLNEELGDDNQAVLQGIGVSLWNVDKQIQELSRKGFIAIKS